MKRVVEKNTAEKMMAKESTERRMEEEATGWGSEKRCEEESRVHKKRPKLQKLELEAEPETERFVFCQRSLSGDSAGEQIKQAVQVAR